MPTLSDPQSWPTLTTPGLSDAVRARTAALRATLAKLDAERVSRPQRLLYADEPQPEPAERCYHATTQHLNPYL